MVAPSLVMVVSCHGFGEKRYDAVLMYPNIINKHLVKAMGSQRGLNDVCYCNGSLHWTNHSQPWYSYGFKLRTVLSSDVITGCSVAS